MHELIWIGFAFGLPLLGGAAIAAGEGIGALRNLIRDLRR